MGEQLAAGNGKRTILVVDDDDDLRLTLSQILEEEGYSVASASNGQEALIYLRQSRAPQLILLDLMMPVMNGWQFRTQQMADPKLASIPVLVLSAGGQYVQQTAPIDAVGFIKKPADLNTLLAVVKRHAC